jgi:hypothetical protein
MAASSTSTLANSLKKVYADRYFKAFQDEHIPLMEQLQECPEDPVYGSGWYFPFTLNTKQTSKVNSEGGGMGTVRQRSEIQGQVNAVEFIDKFQITEMLKNAGRDVGAFGNEVNRHMEETTGDITKFMQRQYSISHGTGRLAVVAADTVGTNAFVGANNTGVVALMEGDYIDIYDAESGGALQLDSRKVTDIDRITRTVTFDGAVASLTAGWHVYKEDSYGYAPNGLHGLVDDGTNAGSVHGQSRTSYPKLKSRVRGSRATVDGDLTEEKMRQMCDDIYRVGGYVDRIFCNVGGANAYLDITDGDRRYQMTRGKTAQRMLGYVEGDLLFSYHNGNIPIKLNPNLPAREMYFVSWKKSFRKHTLRKLGFLTDSDRGGSPLHLAPDGSGGFTTSWIAIVCAQQNISCRAPIWNGLLTGWTDKSVAGDS